MVVRYCLSGRARTGVGGCSTGPALKKNTVQNHGSVKGVTHHFPIYFISARVLGCSRNLKKNDVVMFN